MYWALTLYSYQKFLKNEKIAPYKKLCQHFSNKKTKVFDKRCQDYLVDQ